MGIWVNRGSCQGYMGIMDKNMETTVMGYIGSRGLGFRGGLRGSVLRHVRIRHVEPSDATTHFDGQVCSAGSPVAGGARPVEHIVWGHPGGFVLAGTLALTLSHNPAKSLELLKQTCSV